MPAQPGQRTSDTGRHRSKPGEEHLRFGERLLERQQLEVG
jgi:hypothetical protein